MVNIPSPPITAVSAQASSRRDWVIVGTALALGLCSFGLIFRSEIETAIYVWINSDAYNHCFLVLPVAAYLAWDRRQAVAVTTPHSAPWIALLAIPVAAAWFVADRLGIMEGRQLMAMTLLQIMVAALLGLRSWRALAAPLLYLFFLVPFGEFVVPPFQVLVVHFTTATLDLLGIPNLSTGVTLEIPEGTFIVHEACSGLRFLIASAAFGVLYACVIFTTPLRRLLFIALSLAVAIIGNCLRVVGIILIAHFMGNAQAVETGHVLWGWFFYLIIGSVLIVIGLAFRQEGLSAVRADPPPSGRTTGASVIALTLMILVATTPRVAANYLDQLDLGTAVAAQIEMPALQGCMVVQLSAAQPAPSAEDTLSAAGSRSSAYQCGGELFVLTLRRYPPRIGVRPLFASLRAATAPPGWDIILQTGDFHVGSGPAASVWRVTEASTEGKYATIATALWLDGQPAGTGIAARVNQALNTVRRSAVSPVLAVVTHFGGDSPNSARHTIDTFLPRTASLSESVSKWISAP
jgi:exosortase A